MVMAAPVPLRRRRALLVVATLLAVVTAAMAQEACNGVFLTYTFMERAKEYPHLKKAAAQPYAFKATATVLNTMTEDLKAWQMFVGFQHKEILVSVGGAVLLDGSDLPANVSGGATFAGYPMADLLNSIETAGEPSLIESKIEITGTQFGVKAPGKPMPKTIKLTNPVGFRCPAPNHKDSVMYVCCVKDRKFKAKKANSTRYQTRRKADLTFAYDVLQANTNNYQVQVTIDNWSPISRLDNWNLTWEWKRGEFIYSMKGAYTLLKEGPACIYSPAAGYYKDMDFTPVYNCEKRPVIVDLPPEREKDDAVGNLPFCCKNGTLLPPTMDPSKSRAMFQMQVYKLPPDLNRTALYPPQNWKISGKLNPQYACGPPVRVSPQEFPDPTGLMSTTPAVASWQVACNITRPKKRASKCCVSFSAYYNDSVRPGQARHAAATGGAARPVRQPVGQGTGVGQDQALAGAQPHAVQRQLRRQHQLARHQQLQVRLVGAHDHLQLAGLHLQGLVCRSDHGQPLQRLRERLLLQRHADGRPLQQHHLHAGGAGPRLPRAHHRREDDIGTQASRQAAVGHLVHQERRAQCQHSQRGRLPQEDLLRRRGVRAPG
ncbi:Brittle stalk-2-like protein 5 [Zea mays]|uniref:Brittle stalk-2-like protein 5 n=1 Tax=Zea mays TaxID=4577 RepID=A0A1D6IDT1_MAIZE|nr:Brittle stalk-2-like protein 5 [Zea mays]